MRSLSEHNRIRLERVPPRAAWSTTATASCWSTTGRRSTSCSCPRTRAVPRTVLGRLAPVPAARTGRRTPGARRRVGEQAAAVRGHRAPPRPRLGSASSRSRRISSSCRASRCRSARGATIRSAPLAAHLLGYVGEVSDDELAAGSPATDMGDLIGKAGLEKAWERSCAASPAGSRSRSTRSAASCACSSEVPDVPGRTPHPDARPRPAGRPPSRRSAIRTARSSRSIRTTARCSPWCRSRRSTRTCSRAASRARSGARSSQTRIQPLEQPRDPGPVSAGLDLQGRDGRRARSRRRRHQPVHGASSAAAASTSATTTSAAGRRAVTAASNLHEAIVESCDVFFYQVGQRLGVDTHRRVRAPLRARRADRHRARAREAAASIPDSAVEAAALQRAVVLGRDAVGRDRPGLRDGDAAPDGERDRDDRQRRRRATARTT